SGAIIHSDRPDLKQECHCLSRYWHKFFGALCKTYSRILMTLQPNMHLLSGVSRNALPCFAMQNDWKGQEDKRKRKLTLCNRIMSPDAPAKQFSTECRVQ